MPSQRNLYKVVNKIMVAGSTVKRRVREGEPCSHRGHRTGDSGTTNLTNLHESNLTTEDAEHGEKEQSRTRDSFFTKIRDAITPFNLILYNLDLDKTKENGIIPELEEHYPALLDRIVFISSEKHSSASNGRAVLNRPFSLDHFREVVKKTCVN